MANKLDTARPLFMGPNPARENTVVDHIRRAVAALDKGAGVAYQDLEDYLLQNYTPAKSQNYSGSFVKSYVRDAVNKYGYLSYENGGHDYAAEAAPTPKEPRPKRVSKARREQLELMKWIRDAGEVAHAGDVDNTQITPDDIAGELGRRRNWVDSRVKELCDEGLLRVEENDGSPTLVYLTAAGYAAVNAEYPEGAASEAGAEEGEPSETSE